MHLADVSRVFCLSDVLAFLFVSCFLVFLQSLPYPLPLAATNCANSDISSEDIFQGPHTPARRGIRKMEVSKDLEMAETTGPNGVINDTGRRIEKQFVFKKRFPWLTEELAIKYKAHQMDYLDIFAVSPMVVVVYVVIATRANLQYVGSSSYLFTLAFTSMLLVTAAFSAFVTAHVCRLYWRQSTDEWKISCALRSEKFLLNSFFWRIEDFIGVFATLVAGFYLIARVKAGQCPSENIWDTQACNPVAYLHSIPTDQVIFLYTVPIICQVILRGITLTALTICYGLALVFVAVSVAHVEGGAELWIVLYIVIFVNVAMEFERWMRISVIFHL